MKIVLLHCTSSYEKWLSELIEQYQKKIQHFVSFEIQNVDSKKKSRKQSEVKKESDSNQILEFIDDQDLVVLFDERGKSLDSVQMSKELNQILNSGKKKCVFVVGGAYGASEALKKRANKTLSLSALTLNHQFAVGLVAEQIYRSFTILKNIPYHNS